MRKRHPNPRLAKSLLTYDVAEIARLYGCHRGTVRNWLRSGLEAIDDRRPTLVRGEALNAFHRVRRESGKRPCGPGELYCPPCGAPKRPSEDMVDATRVSPKLWRVAGLCPDCGRSISQRAGWERMQAFRSLAGFVERGQSDN